ncbi:MAG TPA: polyprenyl synthetase family protein [Thermomicrobiaceae bacterium]|nr:polyprenyl synthetase family protein [Thermomicrobiaceae bacterium]
MVELAPAVQPADWPAVGPIDLLAQDPPHASATSEWWYVNTHLETADGAAYSLFASFFRSVVDRDPATGAPRHAHSVTWALCDPVTGRYHANALVDPHSPEIIRRQVADGRWVGDDLLRQAILDVVEKGAVPLPDRLMARPADVESDTLRLDFDGNRLVKDRDGCYRLDLIDDERSVGACLTFEPAVPPIRHGDHGVVRGADDEDMFYYSIPWCRVAGTLTLEGRELPVRAGQGWYDHEFGRPRVLDTGEVLREDIAWNWMALQLDGGRAVSVYELFDRRGCDRGRWAIVVDPNGTPTRYDTFVLEPLEQWTSARTFREYPTRWRLAIPAAGLSLTVAAAFEGQEFITVIKPPAFWEGRVHVAGSLAGAPARGLGFVERSGFDPVERVDRFFGAVGRQVRRSVAELLPREPTPAQALRLVASERHAHYLDGLSIAQYARVVIDPLRDIIDRGGKAWRSYGLLACCDLVGGNPQEFMAWLAVPELLHTGSLIVDDVQDRSAVRRGGPSCHVVYGEPLAINAGTTAYFVGQVLLANSNLPAADQLRIYDLYFEALRAAHAGQAIDIDGHRELGMDAVELGRGELLERRVLAAHRLKSAVPARSLAMVGAILGGGTAEETGVAGDYFERLGLAFQIVDDALNLRGFERDLKTRGEDLAEGKLTLPVAKALSRLPLAERRQLWRTIADKPRDPDDVAAAIALVAESGALDACEEQARELVEDGWRRLDAQFPDSQVKLMLRAFGQYVLERQY